MSKENVVVRPYNGILLGKKKQWKERKKENKMKDCSTRWMNLEKQYVKWKMPHPGVSNTGKSTEAEGGFVVAPVGVETDC